MMGKSFGLLAIWIIITGIFIVLVLKSHAATPTSPSLPQSQNASGTIAVTGTFQSIWPTQSRALCQIQNNGTHVMSVFFGPIASATTATSYQLAAGLAVSCNSGFGVLYDQVSITGTAADVFYANEQ
jgi:hypothetical protein